MDIHPSDKLVLYMSGELIPDELEAVDAHLRGCNFCRYELDELKAGDSLLSLYGRIVNSKEVCPMPEKLSQFVDGTNINDSERDGIKHHIAKCSDCHKQIELLMQLNKDMLTIVTEESSNIVPLLPDYLRSSIREKYPKVLKKRFFPAIHAATILIVIGFFLWFFKFNPVTEHQITGKAPITFAPSAPTDIAPKTHKPRTPRKSLNGHFLPNKETLSGAPSNIAPKTHETAAPGEPPGIASNRRAKIKTYSEKPKVSEFKEEQMKNLAEKRNQNYQAPLALEEGTSSLSGSKEDTPGDLSMTPGNKPNETRNKERDESVTLQNLEEQLKTGFALSDVKVQVIIGRKFGYENIIGREVIVSTTALLSQEKQEVIRQYLIVKIPLNPEVDLVRFVVRQTPQIP